MLPNLLFIGAQKAGTSWVASALNLHDDIWVPPAKEIHYFDTLEADQEKFRLFFRKHHREIYTNPEKFAEDKSWWTNFLNNRDGSEYWYGSLYPAEGYKYCVDATPSYSVFGPEQIKSIAKLLPDARILFVMRNPIQRAWSQLCYETEFDPSDPEIPDDKYGHPGRADGGVQGMKSEDIQGFLSHPRNVFRTGYWRTMVHWEYYFPRNRIHYGFYEDIFSDPVGEMGRILRFLELEIDNIDIESFKDRYINKTEKPYEVPDDIRLFLVEKHKDMVRKVRDHIDYLPESWLQDFEL